VGRRIACSKALQNSIECVHFFLLSVEVKLNSISTHAYSNLDLTVDEYKINKLSRVEYEESNIVNETQKLNGFETYAAIIRVKILFRIN